MSCRDATNLLPLFFDGELDARQMRAVALHGTRCNACEGELRQMERFQTILNESLSMRVDEIDLSAFWSAIEQRIGTVQVPWWKRLRLWWSEGDHGLRWPALALAAAVLALTLLFLTRLQQPTAQPDAPQIAVVDNAASIEALDADSDSVAVLNDPETRTTVLWVSDDIVNQGDGP
jgi:anti-sigma factor RsiW